LNALLCLFQGSTVNIDKRDRAAGLGKNLGYARSHGARANHGNVANYLGFAFTNHE
jgi:hypothetical protein